MTMQNDAATYDIGCVYTPARWALWLLNAGDVFGKWLRGRRILDPTCGDGSFLTALCLEGVKRGYSIDELPLDHLYGFDRDGEALESFKILFFERFGRHFPPRNLFCRDVVLDPPRIKVDIIVGNPPWQNFVDLPQEYKTKIKPYFEKYGLVKNKNSVLLGTSRVDICALIINAVVHNHLESKGELNMFVPLSLFLNDGSHESFRNLRVHNRVFSIQALHDLNAIDVFGAVATRYGAVFFKADIDTVYPLPYYIHNKERTDLFFAAPLTSPNDAYSIGDKTELTANNLRRYTLSPACKPRQGANTCGANDVFIFENILEKKDTTFILSNRKYKVEIEKEFVYPLITKNNFNEDAPVPRKWICLPYDPQTGKPVEKHVLEETMHMHSWLEINKDILQARKGVFINSWIKKGRWWALLGVGMYSFSSEKIIWPAYGGTDFMPKYFAPFDRKPWQANQAMHASMSFKNKNDLDAALSFLQSKGVKQYINSFRMNGSKSYAQPGKVSKLFVFDENVSVKP